MTVLNIIRTFLEILAVLLAAYAIYNADRINAFEAKLFKALRYYRHKNRRMKAYGKIMRDRAFVLTVDNSGQTEASPTVAEKEAG